MRKPKTALISIFDEVCLGLRAIGAMLKRENYPFIYVNFKLPQDQMRAISEDDIIDSEWNHSLHYSKKDVDDLIDILVKEKVEIVGISVVSTCHNEFRYLTKEIQNRLNIPVVWGGIEAIVNPDISIRAADIVCTGEGDYVMPKLVDALNDRDFSKIDGIWYNKHGLVFKNKPLPPIENLDELPFPDWGVENYYLLTGNKVYHNELLGQLYTNGGRGYVMSGRGCPFRCSYCCHSATTESGIMQWKIRRHSVDYVIEYLSRLKKQFKDIKEIFFGDEIFSLDKEWIKEFSKKYKKQINIDFACYTYPGNRDEEIYGFLKDAGLRKLIMGVQSGSLRTNKELYDRDTNNSDVFELAKILNNLEIEYLIEVIGHNKKETDEDNKQTLNLFLGLSGTYHFNGVYQLMYLRNYKLTKNTDITTLNQYNPTMYIDGETPYSNFWSSLFLIASIDKFDDEFWQTLIAEHTNGKLSEDMIKVLVKLSRSFRRLDKYESDHYTTQIKKSTIISQYEEMMGSRIVRFALRIRNVVKRLRERFK